MERNYQLYLKDILDSIFLIQEYTRGISEEEFKVDKKLQDAVIRRFQVIGEAASKIPRTIREVNSSIPWDNLQNLRNSIIHTYFEASLRRVWRIVQEDLENIKLNLEKIKLL